MLVHFLVARTSLSHFSGVFSTGGTIYYCHCPLAPAIFGQSITVSTRNSKVLNTPLLRSICFHSRDETPSHWNYFHKIIIQIIEMKKHKFIDHPVSACPPACLPAMARVVGKFPSAFHLLFLRRRTMWSKPFRVVFLSHISMVSVHTTYRWNIMRSHFWFVGS